MVKFVSDTRDARETPVIVAVVLAALFFGCAMTVLAYTVPMLVFNAVEMTSSTHVWGWFGWMPAMGVAPLSAIYVIVYCLSGAGNPVNLPAYRDKVLERFGNDAIRDTNQRVTADSFSKIPGFILPTIRDRLKQDQSIDAVAMLPAMFLVFLTRWHEGKLPFEYHDQSMDPRAAHTIVEADDPVKALVADRLLWQELAGDRRLEEAVRKALVRVQKEVLPQG